MLPVDPLPTFASGMKASVLRKSAATEGVEADFFRLTLPDAVPFMRTSRRNAAQNIHSPSDGLIESTEHQCTHFNTLAWDRMF